MTQEQKAKAYDEALKRANNLYKDAVETECNWITKTCEIIFPQLKESEDEKIKKVLIGYFNEYKEYEECGIKTFYGIPIDNIIAWLEKQKSTDDVELKFKVGDWIVSDNNNVAHIESISETKYNLKCKDGYHEKMSIEYVDRCWHLWTIQDAKDGDILVSSSNQPFIYNGKVNAGTIGSHGGVLSDGRTFKCSLNECNWTYNAFIHPATKEQRDLLFSKMKEADYKLDEKFNVVKI